MGYEVATRLVTEHTTHLYACETIETTDDIAARVQQISAIPVHQLALVTILLGFEPEGRAGSPTFIDANKSSIYLLNSLRPQVRKTDVVFLLGYTWYFLLLGANLQGAQIVQSRLWDALLWRIHNATDGEILRPCSISSGYSAYPAPQRDIDEFIEAANDINLRSNFASEKLTRKTTVRQARTTPQNDADEDLQILARKLGIPYLSLLPRKPPQHVQQLVNPRLAQELRCYPLGRERNRLTVAMLNPQDRLALERLQQETGLDIFPVLTHPQELQTALEQMI